jgi:2-oxoglutarate/2-oxoacid ferredoxin oxidoreductase subunit beta
VQNVMPRLGIPREKIAFVSGIGCSSRFPYYMNTYGMHSIHGRAPAIAMGLKCARPDLSVWVVTGDGDSLSIGTNHLIHCLRRNLDINILLFNNEIYGLTKGQYSPTSEFGKKTKSSPYGTIEQPINPIELALSAEATFVARTAYLDQKHLGETLEAAARHKGTSFVEILQTCLVFNDGLLGDFNNADVRAEEWVYLQPGKPIRFGKGGRKGIVLRGVQPAIVDLDQDGVREEDLLLHDPQNAPRLQAYLLAGMRAPALPAPLGIFRDVQKPTYDDLLMQQVRDTIAANGKGELPRLFKSGTTWLVD